MFEVGDRYVLSSADTLYKLSNSSCQEGSTVNLSGQTVVRMRFINGKWYKQDEYSLGNYSSSTYICHIYNGTYEFVNPSYFILPATIIVLALFSCIYHWFLRLRG